MLVYSLVLAATAKQSSVLTAIVVRFIVALNVRGKPVEQAAAEPPTNTNLAAKAASVTQLANNDSVSVSKIK